MKLMALNNFDGFVIRQWHLKKITLLAERINQPQSKQTIIGTAKQHMR